MERGGLVDKERSCDYLAVQLGHKAKRPPQAAVFWFVGGRGETKQEQGAAFSFAHLPQSMRWNGWPMG